MKREKWKNTISKRNPILTPIKRKCKGGYPCGTRPGDGGLADGGGVSEGAGSIPVYSIEKATLYLEKGYKLEVVFDTKTKKTRSSIITTDNNTLGRIRTDTRDLIMDKVPLKIVDNAKYRTVWGYDYSFDPKKKVSESTETAFWDMPFIKQTLGVNLFDKHVEDEEEVKDGDPDKDKLANDIVDKILALNKKKKKKNLNKSEKNEIVDEIVDELVDEEKEDPNKAGLIRFVKGAHLVYKRQSEDGSYEELWIYPISKQESGHKIKRAILAGTDIDISAEQSEDGKQSCELWTSGNAQLVNILGLPN